ncbi:MAG: hypothetical protein R3E58_13070 [Phycisphaerae bacterium]
MRTGKTLKRRAACGVAGDIEIGGVEQILWGGSIDPAGSDLIVGVEQSAIGPGREELCGGRLATRRTCQSDANIQSHQVHLFRFPMSVWMRVCRIQFVSRRRSPRFE